MSLQVLNVETLPGIEVRWVRGVCSHPDCGCGDPKRLLVLAAAGTDLWVCGGWVAENDDPGPLLDAFREAGDDVLVAKSAAAFGMPWDELTLAMLTGQVALLLGVSEEVMCAIRSRPVAELLGLRALVQSPADMARALRLLHDYAGANQ